LKVLLFLLKKKSLLQLKDMVIQAINSL
jgi:hypothetical protein